MTSQYSRGVSVPLLTVSREKGRGRGGETTPFWKAIRAQQSCACGIEQLAPRARRVEVGEITDFISSSLLGPNHLLVFLHTFNVASFGGNLALFAFVLTRPKWVLIFLPHVLCIILEQ